MDASVIIANNTQDMRSSHVVLIPDADAANATMVPEEYRIGPANLERMTGGGKAHGATLRMNRIYVGHGAVHQWGDENKGTDWEPRLMNGTFSGLGSWPDENPDFVMMHSTSAVPTHVLPDNIVVRILLNWVVSHASMRLLIIPAAIAQQLLAEDQRSLLLRAMGFVYTEWDHPGRPRLREQLWCRFRRSAVLPSVSALWSRVVPTLQANSPGLIGSGISVDRVREARDSLTRLRLLRAGLGLKIRWDSASGELWLFAPRSDAPLGVRLIHSDEPHFLGSEGLPRGARWQVLQGDPRDNAGQVALGTGLLLLLIRRVLLPDATWREPSAELEAQIARLVGFDVDLLEEDADVPAESKRVEDAAIWDSTALVSVWDSTALESTSGSYEQGITLPYGRLTDAEWPPMGVTFTMEVFTTFAGAMHPTMMIYAAPDPENASVLVVHSVDMATLEPDRLDMQLVPSQGFLTSSLWYGAVTLALRLRCTGGVRLADQLPPSSSEHARRFWGSIEPRERLTDLVTLAHRVQPACMTPAFVRTYVATLPGVHASLDPTPEQGTLMATDGLAHDSVHLAWEQTLYARAPISMKRRVRNTARGSNLRLRVLTPSWPDWEEDGRDDAEYEPSVARLRATGQLFAMACLVAGRAGVRLAMRPEQPSRLRVASLELMYARGGMSPDIFNLQFMLSDPAEEEEEEADDAQLSKKTQLGVPPVAHMIGPQITGLRTVVLDGDESLVEPIVRLGAPRARTGTLPSSAAIVTERLIIDATGVDVEDPLVDDPDAPGTRARMNARSAATCSAYGGDSQAPRSTCLRRGLCQAYMLATKSTNCKGLGSALASNDPVWARIRHRGGRDDPAHAPRLPSTARLQHLYRTAEAEAEMGEEVMSDASDV